MGYFVVAAALGILVGTSELVSRYRDKPTDIGRHLATYLYLTLNGGASAAALGIINALGWDFGAGGSTTSEWIAVLVAGTSAMAILRSSIATVRIQGVEVAVGPQAFLDALMGAADRDIDRARAKKRDTEISYMDGLDFMAAVTILPSYCFQLLQNSSSEEEMKVGASIRALISDPVPDAVKVRIVGLQLMAAVGPEVLEQAVTSLRPTLESPLPTREEPDLSDTATAVVEYLAGMGLFADVQEQLPRLNVPFDTIGASDPGEGDADESHPAGVGGGPSGDADGGASDSSPASPARGLLHEQATPE